MTRATHPDTRALADVAAERCAQIARGFTPEHDDGHEVGEIAAAAAHYVMAAATATRLGSRQYVGHPLRGMFRPWPWHVRDFRAGPVRRMLVKAAALIVAEISRLDRLNDAPEAVAPPSPAPRPRKHSDRHAVPAELEAAEG